MILVAGLAMGGSALLARAIDARLVGRIVGTPVGSTGAFEVRQRGGGLSERWDGFVATWLRPGVAGDRGASVLVVLAAAVLVVMAAVALRRSRPDVAVVAAVVGAGLLASRALVLAAGPIPALLVAFPILGFSLVAMAAKDWTFGRRALLLAGGLALSWLGVLATQYAEGGVAEWGGRYFAVGLPIAAPIVVAASARLIDRAPAPQSDWLRWALAFCLAALSVAAVRELRRGHDTTARALDRISELAAEAGPDPVIVTDAPAIPRLDWARFDERRWLLVDPASDPGLPERLAAEGVDRWLIVSSDVEGALDAFDGVTVVGEASPNIVLVETRS